MCARLNDGGVSVKKLLNTMFRYITVEPFTFNVIRNVFVKAHMSCVT